VGKLSANDVETKNWNVPLGNSQTVSSSSSLSLGQERVSDFVEAHPNAKAVYMSWIQWTSRSPLAVPEMQKASDSERRLLSLSSSHA